MIKKISLIFLISILAVFPYCAADETPQSDQPPVYNITGGNNQNTGTLYLNLTESGEKQSAVKSADTRTATPVVDMTRESFRVVGTCTDGSMFELLTEHESIKIQGISVGTWTLLIESVNKDGISIAYGEGTVEIVQETTSTLGVTLYPYSGFGQIQLTITWEEDLENASIEGTLARSGGIPYDIPFVISGNTATASLTGPAGYYIMRVSLYDAGEVHTFVGGTVDVLRIVADETTPGLYTIIANSQYGYGELDIEMLVDMNDPINIELSGTLPSFEQGESMTVTASSPGDTDTIEYTWFLNSECRGTGSTHTINGNLPTGQYRLDVLAFNSIGDRGGSVTYMFEILEATVNTPGNLRTTSVTPDRIDLAWDDLSDNEDGFIIQRSINGGGFTQLAAVDEDSTSYSDTSVQPGETYTYRIKAYWGFIESAYAVSESVTTPEYPPADLSYSVSTAVYTVGEEIVPNTATVTGEYLTFIVSPALPEGLSIDAATGTISGTPSAEQAAAVYTVTASNTGGNVTANITITVNYPAPVNLTYSANPAVYAEDLQITDNIAAVTGSGISFSVNPALPSGLTLNTATGAISGTPVNGQSAAVYTVTAANSGGSVSVNLTISVTYTAPSALSYSENPAEYTAGHVIDDNMAAVTGSGITFSVNPALPSGLTLNTSTGTISGIPGSAQGAAVYTVTASNSGGATSVYLTITIIEGTSFTGLVAHWILDGNVLDSVGTGHGTLYGSPLPSFTAGPNGLPNTAMNFNGTNQYVSCNTGQLSDNVVSVAFWMRPTSTANGVMLDHSFGNHSGWFIRKWDNSTRISVHYRDANYNDYEVYWTGLTLLNVWTHVAFTIDGENSEIRLYINGILYGTVKSMTGVFAPCNGNLYMGSDYYNSTFFNGDISDVRIYNCVLPLNDIKQLYFDKKLIAGYSFEEGTGTDVYDATDFGNDGIIYGNPVWTTGYSGGALSFDGIGDYVNCGNDASLNITDVITLGAWIKAVPGSEAETSTQILRPDSAGSETSIKYQTPETAAHWDKTDDVTPDDNSTFVYQAYSAESGLWRRDLFNIPSASITAGTINKITVHFRVKRYQTSSRNGDAMAAIRTHNTTYDGTVCPISSFDTWTDYTQEWTVNPYTGSAWTWSEIEGLEIGVSLRMYYSSYYGSRVGCTQVYAEIEYTPPVIIAGKGKDSYAIGIDQDNFVWGYINNNTVKAAVTDPSTIWHSVVLTYDGSAERLYIDGALANSLSLSGSISVNASELIIGNTILGQIDELMIYNCAMSADEIADRY